MIGYCTARELDTLLVCVMICGVYYRYRTDLLGNRIRQLIRDGRVVRTERLETNTQTVWLAVSRLVTLVLSRLTRYIKQQYRRWFESGLLF